LSDASFHIGLVSTSLLSAAGTEHRQNQVTSHFQSFALGRDILRQQPMSTWKRQLGNRDLAETGLKPEIDEGKLLDGLLSYSRSRTPAADLLQHFQSIGHVLSAEVPQLNVLGLTARDVALLRLVRDTACLLAKAQIRARPTLNNWPALIGYLQTAMTYEQIEQFRVLFLDRKNNLIADEVQQIGTVSHTPVYPREVMKRALILNASALIVVHNHPSGDPQPSTEDVAMTRELKQAAQALGCELLDHVVVGHGKTASFRSLSLL
jgi:DNA repair protein RadC